MRNSARKTEPNPKVLIWREVLLPSSETFVWGSETASAYNADLGGMVRIAGYKPGPKQHVFMESKISRIVYRISGRCRKLERFLVQGEFEIIHAHFGWDAIWIYRLSRRLAIPIIVSLHGYDVLKLTRAKSVRQFIYLHVAKKVLPKVDRILATSDFIRDNAIQIFGIAETKIFTHYIGSPVIDSLPSFITRSDLLFVGRLIQGKGLSSVLKGFNLYSKKFPDTNLTVIGDGPERIVSEEFCEANSLPVIFLGSVSHQRVSQEMKRSLLLIMPSTSTMGDPEEGLGMVAVEALAHGLPILAFENGGIPEVLGEFSDYLIPDDGNADNLASKITLLMSDKTTLSKQSELGRARHRAVFNKKKQDMELVRHYKEIRSIR